MRNGIPTLYVVLTIATAACLMSLMGDKTSADSSPQPMSRAAVLMQEFRTGESRSGQLETAKKLIALRDKSIVPQMLALLNSESRIERCNAGLVLAGLGEDRGLFAVIAELQDRGNRPNTDEEALHEGWPKDKAPARQIIGDRYYAAHILREIGDKRAVPALIATLQDESISYQTAIVLGHLGDKRAIPALLVVLDRAQSPKLKANRSNMDMKLWAGYGLMWLRHPRGLAAVSQCLGTDPEWGNRRHAADAFGELGNKAAVPFLLKALKDKNVEVRVNAITALGRIGDKRAIPALKALLLDQGKVQASARVAYKSPPPFFKPLTVREAAARALGQIENEKSASPTGKRH